MLASRTSQGAGSAWNVPELMTERWAGGAGEQGLGRPGQTFLGKNKGKFQSSAHVLRGPARRSHSREGFWRTGPASQAPCRRGGALGAWGQSSILPVLCQQVLLDTSPWLPTAIPPAQFSNYLHS